MSVDASTAVDAPRTGTAAVRALPRTTTHRAAVENVFSPTVVRYRTQLDYPLNFAAGDTGHPMTVVSGSHAQRDDYRVAILTGPVTFTPSCIPASADPGAPCMTDANGPVAAKREWYTFRLSYLDPNNPNAPELDLDVTNFRTDGFLVRSPNDTTTIEGSLWPHQPSCGIPFGPGYRARVFIQYSPYAANDPIPAGADEWLPATILATKTRLAVPGVLLWQNDWSLAPSNAAIQVQGNGFLRPAVEAHTLGGAPTTQTATGSDSYPTITAGVTDLYVVAADCGVPFPNVPFTFLSSPHAATNGHVHNGGVVTPPPTAIADVPAFITGLTGPDGRSQPFHVTAGKFGGVIDIGVHGDNIGAPGFSSSNQFAFMVGFPWLQPFTLIPEDIDLGTTGATAYHPLGSNHYGVPELFELIRWAPTEFRTNVRPDAKKLTVNDMSLELGGYFDLNGDWQASGSHITHRLGFDVDIDRFFTDFNGAVHKMTPQEVFDFKAAMVNDGFARTLTEIPIHFRLKEEDIDKYLASQP